MLPCGRSSSLCQPLVLQEEPLPPGGAQLHQPLLLLLLCKMIMELSQPSHAESWPPGKTQDFH